VLAVSWSTQGRLQPVQCCNGHRFHKHAVTAKCGGCMSCLGYQQLPAIDKRLRRKLELLLARSPSSSQARPFAATGCSGTAAALGLDQSNCIMRLHSRLIRQKYYFGQCCCWIDCSSDYSTLWSAVGNMAISPKHGVTQSCRGTSGRACLCAQYLDNLHCVFQTWSC